MAEQLNPKVQTKWRFRNTSILIIIVLLSILFADSPPVVSAINAIGNLGILGIFMTGMFFVSTFTALPATLVLFNLTETFNPLVVALIAGMGAVAGDYIIFRFVKDGLFDELRPTFHKYGGTYLVRLFGSPFFGWLSPVIGAFLIASPLPDEVGITLMGISALKNWQFVALSFILNFLGIYILVSAALFIASP